ncbi:DUF6443 domain-containing protein [Olivibacter ginsenosidimutans]|uniref:DUF6443 domain-containing protein n=1 Tax=Olivibacter ginsenosidimutans TaxID=1176537 RepID=UPI003CD07823
MFAGTGTAGSANGSPLSATFNAPEGVCTDASGNIYVADTWNQRIRRMGKGQGYSVSPALPAGLTLNKTTGLISGTPTAAKALTTYTITAHNAAGNAITTVSFAVVQASILSSNRNYIHTTTYLQAFTSVPGAPTTTQAMQDVTYYDGLGRPEQEISVKAAPGAAKDMVVPHAYDAFGREDKKYLPYATATGAGGAYKTSSVTAQATYYNSGSNYGTVTIPAVSGVTPSFAKTVYEASPLERVLEEGAPGQVWQPAAARTTATGHTVVTEYTTNNNELLSAVEKTRKVMLYRVGRESNGTPKLELTASQSYGSNQLYVTVRKDENWDPTATGFNARLGTSEEYTDKQGRMVLKRTFNQRTSGSTVTNEMLSTYYVYDDFGNLTYVLPPGGTPDRATLPTGTALTEWLDRYAYQYRYDGRNRMSHRKVPGKGMEYFNYNLMDQLVIHMNARDSLESYDGFSKPSANTRYHRFYKYDGLGRVVISGMEKNRTATQASIAKIIEEQTIPQWEERSTASGNLHGYTHRAVPTDVQYFDVLEVNYYDRYAGIPDLPSNLDKSAEAAYSKMTQGLPVAKKTKVLGTTDTYLWTVYYYDERGDNVRTLSQHYKGGAYNTNNYDDIKNEYTFTHQLKKSTREHHAGSATASLVVTTEYSYDHRDRLTDTWKTVKSGTVQGARILVSRNVYNEVGQLKTKQLHSADGGSTFGQDIAYSYNERGWLRMANAALFSQELRYNTGTTKYYNGNIAYQLYSRKHTDGTTVSGTYSYGYDKVNRLTWGMMAGGRGREGVAYDLMGNITTLNRRDSNGATADSLSYSYNSLGQLDTVRDRSTNTSTAYMLPGSSTYTYDANGNLKTRVNTANTGKNITATVYNYLDLPQRVTVNGTTISYTYDGSGRKLRSVNGINGQTRDYIDGIEYSGGSIELVEMEEGRLLNAGSNKYDYEYILKDHLGNSRSGFTGGTGVATSATLGTDYYPYGLQYLAKLATGSPKNNYLYNGKELQDKLGMYDYGARYYDPIIGRWGSVDPLAENMREYSPYNYALDNPIKFVDPNGKETFYGEQAQEMFRQLKMQLAGSEGSDQDDDKREKKHTKSELSPEERDAQARAYMKGLIPINKALLEMALWREVVISGFEVSYSYLTNFFGSKAAPKTVEVVNTVESVAAKTGLQLEKSVVNVMGKSYKAAGEVTVPIKNTELLNKLNATSKGDWVKVYEAGIQKGSKIETHYFRNNTTGQVFDVKTKYNYWHQKAFKNLGQ